LYENKGGEDMSEESVKNDIKISINYMIPGKYTEKEII